MVPRQQSPKLATPHLAMQSLSDYQSCATLLKALSDPDRLQIVNQLLQGAKCVSELAEELDAPIDKVSHHLAVLRSARLVRTHKQGKFVIYSLTPQVAPKDIAADGKMTIDLGCCQLDLVQFQPPRKKARASARQASR